MTSRSVVSTQRLQVIHNSLGVLSIHLEGAVCRVGCEFCYLGQRTGDPAELLLPLVERALERLNYDEVAVAVSEPALNALPALRAIRRAIGQRRLTVTTTLQVARTPGLFDGIDRVSLSIDPRKGTVSPSEIGKIAAGLAPEVVLIVSLTTPEFAARLIEGGLLEELIDLPSVGKVTLNALKPPPAWCGRQFWMAALARLAPLLERALDEKLFLDCWVAARLLHLGGCPARADLTPARSQAGAIGLAFRACVYQPAADFVTADADELQVRLRDFVAPAECPFPIPP
jgi:hypothetical protein